METYDKKETSRSRVCFFHIIIENSLLTQHLIFFRESGFTPDNLFTDEPLGIFTKPSQGTLNRGPVLQTWDYMKNKDLEIAIAQPPTNYFQKMILWTNQGKIWKFPIDNEQGILIYC